MPSFAKTFATLACIAAAVTALPSGSMTARDNHATTPDNAENCAEPAKACSTDGEGEVFVAPKAVWSIYPQSPDLAAVRAGGVHLETFDNKTQVEQVYTFSGIPAEAQTCTVRIRQGERLGRVFITRGLDELFTLSSIFTPLSGLPAEGTELSYNAYAPFFTEERASSMDWANGWDALPPRDHIGNDIPCSETINLKLAFELEKLDKRVYLGQNDNNGIFISYKC